MVLSVKKGLTSALLLTALFLAAMFHFMKQIIISLVLLFSISSASSTAPKKLYVLAGGFGSCAFIGSPVEMRMWKPLKSLLNRSELKNSNTNILRICFALSKKNIYFDQLVKNENRFYKVRSGKIKSNKVSTLIHSLTLAKEINDLILIGQSHGGDLLLRVAENLERFSPFYRGNTSLRRTLFTVDPVSLKNCNSLLFLKGIFKRHAGCTEFPEKRKDQLDSVVSFSNSWIHFYQDEFSFLHSGSQLRAEESIELNFGNSMHFMGAHGKTERDPRVWNQIYNELNK